MPEPMNYVQTKTEKKFFLWEHHICGWEKVTDQKQNEWSHEWGKMNNYEEPKRKQMNWFWYDFEGQRKAKDV